MVNGWNGGNFVAKEGKKNQRELGGKPLDITWDNGFTVDMAMDIEGWGSRIHVANPT